jgi:hypothetical protein
MARLAVMSGHQRDTYHDSSTQCYFFNCVQRLSENASGYCVSKLIVFIGPNIFKARLDSKQLAILQSSPLISANSLSGGIDFGRQEPPSIM